MPASITFWLIHALDTVLSRGRLGERSVLAFRRSTSKVCQRTPIEVEHSDSSSSPNLEKTTYYNPYTPESVQDSIPPAPLPYWTYDGPDWMITDQAELWRM